MKSQMRSKCYLVSVDPSCFYLSIGVVRNRYVEYAAGRSKDASQIPAEWYRKLIVSICFIFRHGWLHSITDDPPTKVEYTHSIADIGHSENITGTSARYAPYNTTKPKYQSYTGQKREK